MGDRAGLKAGGPPSPATVFRQWQAAREPRTVDFQALAHHQRGGHATGQLIHVIDYEAMGKPYKPRMRHRPDCPHTDQGQVFRPIRTAQERALPECAECARKEQAAQ